ncbi:MAG: UDP-glucose/GDP-mannose dehydrogenase family protein [Methanomassiliicoccales archaeon]|nr:UDP-glucose/GDP-mannose dehydrogenase family protein [Methanomassiliicoccales archaeon]
MNITVVGLGYVGAVAVGVLANAGHNVVGIDVDKNRVASFQQGVCPFYEPGLSELILKGLQAGRIRFNHVNDMIENLGEIILIAVGTPAQPYGGIDLSQVYSAIRWIKAQNPGEAVIVMKSTVPPGTGLRLLAEELSGTNLRYISNPEFLRQGQAVQDWMHPHRIVIGGRDEAAVSLVKKMYAGIQAPFLITDITTAEMIKYAANAFLATKISFINEIANICEKVGANIDDVSRGIGLDPRIGLSYLNAGLGYGGSCLPKDTRALEFLALVKGLNVELIRAVINVNNRQRLLPIQALQETFRSLKKVKVALLGLAFKPNTDDVREAPALDIARLLVELGADVRAYDPKAMESARRLIPEGIELCSSALEALKGAQALILATEWQELLDLPWKKVRDLMIEPRFVFDGRNALDGHALMKLGFNYRGVGRSGPCWSS